MIDFLLVLLHNSAKINSSKKIARMMGGCQADSGLDHKIEYCVPATYSGTVKIFLPFLGHTLPQVDERCSFSITMLYLGYRLVIDS